MRSCYYLKLISVDLLALGVTAIQGHPVYLPHFEMGIFIHFIVFLIFLSSCSDALAE